MNPWRCRLCGDHIENQLDRIEHKLDHVNQTEGKIMAAQDDINAAVAAIQAVVADLGSAVTNIQAEIANLNSQGVDTSGLTAAVAQLQGVQASVDALETPAAPAE